MQDRRCSGSASRTQQLLQSPHRSSNSTSVEHGTHSTRSELIPAGQDLLPESSKHRGLSQTLQEIQLHSVTAQPSLHCAISVLARYTNFPIPGTYQRLCHPFPQLGEAETSTVEVAGTNMRKRNRSTGVVYETERKRMRGHQGNLSLCFPESQLTPPDVHPLGMDNMVHNLTGTGTVILNLPKKC